jgi:hypothetical protein
LIRSFQLLTLAGLLMQSFSATASIPERLPKPPGSREKPSAPLRESPMLPLLSEKRIAYLQNFCNLEKMTATLELGPKGAITLPKKMREKFDLRDRSLISLEETPEGILIRPAVAFPIENYSNERLEEFERENNASIAEFFGK